MREVESKDVAAVTASDGSIVWVEHVPPDLEVGSTVHFTGAEGERSGVVIIPPRLVIWWDPEARCAVFISVQAPPPPKETPKARPPTASFIADQSPVATDRPAMLDLAWREMDRLDR